MRNRKVTVNCKPITDINIDRGNKIKNNRSENK